MALELKVREVRAAVDAFSEDQVALTEYMHATRVAKEDAERDLATAKAQKEAVRNDWQRKLQDRRKEVLQFSRVPFKLFRSPVHRAGSELLLSIRL
jgi:t-SNARE complex subunit (syntaxin)